MVEIYMTLALLPSNRELIGSHTSIVVHCCIDMLGAAIAPSRIAKAKVILLYKMMKFLASFS